MSMDKQYGATPFGKQRGPRNNPLANPPDSKKPDLGGLAGLFKGKDAPYTPVTKSLKQIGLDPIIMDVQLPQEPGLIECLVIPVQSLIYKEWRHMTQSELVDQPQNEENDDQGSAEVGGPGDVQGGSN